MTQIKSALPGQVTTPGQLVRRDSVTLVAVVLLLALLAAILRFYDLGVWPYSGDETATLYEEAILFHDVVVPPEGQAYRLPHLIPLSYLAFHISHTLFGSDEWGTRVIVAVLGILSVVLVFFLLRGPLSRTTAIVAAVLVALMPQHVLHSQETRFYMVAAFFAYASLLAGARILGNRSTAFAILTSGLVFAAVLSHTLLILLLPLIVLGILVGAHAQRQTVPRSTWLVFAAAAVGLVIYAVLHLWPLLHGWNATGTWGYSPLHAIFASVSMIGWPIALLSMVGLVLMWRKPTPQGRYWSVCALGWAGATVVFPLIVTYHPEYVFPLSLGPVVLAAYAVTVIFDLLRTHFKCAAYAWLGLICLANLPGLASYYVDGSRWDVRGAVRYVRDHWSQGDRVTGYSMGLFRHYSQGCCEPTIPLNPQSVSQLPRLGSKPGRTWVVLENTRSGLEPRVQRWLFDCAIHKLSVGGRRFDEAQFSVEVYVISPPLPGACMSVDKD